MKKLLWIALCITGFAQAQEFKFTLGPAMNDEPAGSTSFFNTTLKKGYRITANGFSVAELDDYIRNSGKSTAVKTEIFTGNTKAIVEGYHTVDNKNYLIYSILEKQQIEQIVYMQELSTAMVLLGTPIRLVSFKKSKDLVRVVVVGKNVGLNDLHMVKSESKQHAVFVKERNRQVEVKGFSFEKGELWTKSFDLDHTLDFSLSSIKLSDDGTVYIYGGYYKGEDKLSPFLLAYSPLLGKHKLHTIKSPDKTKDFGYHLTFMDDGTPVYAGLYGQKKEAGYRIYKVRKDNLELELFVSRAFPATYFEVTTSGVFKPEHFDVINLVQLSNDDVVIDIGSEGANIKYQTSPYSAPLYIAAIGADGAEKWSTIIQKYALQSYRSDLIGHWFFHRKNKIYLIYNDNTDNFSLTPIQKPESSLLKNSVYIAVVEIDETGKSKKLNMISESKKQNSSFANYEVFPIDKDRCHFLIKKDGQYHFAIWEPR